MKTHNHWKGLCNLKFQDDLMKVFASPAPNTAEQSLYIDIKSCELFSFLWHVILKGQS